MKKFLCMLAALLCAAMLPLTGLAANIEGGIGVNIDNSLKYAGVPFNIKIKTLLDDYVDVKENTTVKIFFNDPFAVDTLKINDRHNMCWVPLSMENDGSYCIPGDTYDWDEYELSIRVKKGGTYSCIISLTHATEGSLVSCFKDFFVIRVPALMHTDVASKNFVAGTPTEFSFTTFANEDKNRMVVGNASFSDPSAIEKLEYYEPNNGQWYPLEGDFGPAQGFPLSDATSKFRVTFNKAGEYSFTAQLVDVADGEQVCSVDASLCVEAAPEVPETGDNSHLMLWAALAMVSLLGVTTIIRRKENA